MNNNCPNCEKINRSDFEKYGFNLHDGAYYWTIISEIRSCCPIKVKLESHDALTVTVVIEDKKFTKSRSEFMKSSWRDIEAY